MRRFLFQANTQSCDSDGQETGQLFIDECHKENSAKKCLRRRKNTDKSNFNEGPRQKMRPPVPLAPSQPLATRFIEDSPGLVS